jgi:hypothetical protein
LSPKIFICDFEVGLITACKEILNNFSVFCCVFHYGQMIWRKIQALGFTEQYKNNQLYRKIFRMFLNKPFLNPNRISEILYFIDNFIMISNLSDEVKVFLEYYINNFIKTNNRIPRYDIIQWSVFYRNSNQLP